MNISVSPEPIPGDCFTIQRVQAVQCIDGHIYTMPADEHAGDFITHFNQWATIILQSNTVSCTELVQS